MHNLKWLVITGVIFVGCVGCGSSEEETPPPTPTSSTNAPKFGEGKSQQTAEPAKAQSGFTN